LVCGWLTAVSQWNTEHFLLGSERDRGFADDTGGCAVLDLSAVQGSGASDWDDDWCWVVLNDRSVFSWLWLVRSLWRRSWDNAWW
jgi:hypothetical protein